MKWKVYISYIFFIFITVIVASVLSIITTEASPDNAGIRAFYKEPKSQIDAVFMGPSSTYTTFLPPIAYHKYGITTAVYSIPNMVTEQYIYCIKEIIKYQKPKIIFINVDSMQPHKRRHDHLKYTLSSIALIKPSLNKIKMIQEFKNVYRFSYIEILEYYFPIIRFHSKWKEINIDVLKSKSNPHKGAVILKEFYTKKYDINKFKEDQKTKKLSMTQKYKKKKLNKKEQKEKYTAEYTEQIEFLEYAKNINDLFLYLSSVEDTKFILIITPCPNTILGDTELLSIYYIGERYGIESINIETWKKLNIDENNDFLDASHLNFKGAYKTTNYLANLLKSEYKLKDKRTDSKYKSWEKEYKFYKKEIKRKFNVDIESEELENNAINN